MKIFFNLSTIEKQVEYERALRIKNKKILEKKERNFVRSITVFYFIAFFLIISAPFLKYISGQLSPVRALIYFVSIGIIFLILLIIFSKMEKTVIGWWHRDYAVPISFAEQFMNRVGKRNVSDFIINYNNVACPSLNVVIEEGFKKENIYVGLLNVVKMDYITESMLDVNRGILYITSDTLQPNDKMPTRIINYEQYKILKNSDIIETGLY